MVEARIVIPKGSDKVLVTMLLISALCYAIATVAGTFLSGGSANSITGGSDQ